MTSKKITSIVSLNMNCSHPITPAKDLPFKDRNDIIKNELELAFPELPDITGFQEAWSSKIGDMKKKYPSCFVLTPKDYDIKEHKRSMVPALLLKKSVFRRVRRLRLGNGKVMPGRYVYVAAMLKAGPGAAYSEHEIWFILDIHMPQTKNFGGRDSEACEWYRKSRIKGNADLWKAVIKEAKKRIKEGSRFIIMGDLQESSGSGNMKLLAELGMRECVISNLPTVLPGFFPAGSSIDHIMFSPEAYASIKPSKFMLSNGSADSTEALTGYVTDHSMLVCGTRA